MSHPEGVAQKHCVPALKNMTFLRSKSVFQRSKTLFLCSKTWCSCAPKHCVPALKNWMFLPSKHDVPALQNTVFLRSKTGCSCPQNMMFLRSKICSCAQKHDVPALKNMMFLRSKTWCSCTQNCKVHNEVFYFPYSPTVSFGYYSIKISHKRNCNKEREKEEQLNDAATSCIKLHAEECLTMWTDWWKYRRESI